jgi:hypothetical protein
MMLHNMSAPHRTTIRHSAPAGSSRCRRLVVEWTQTARKPSAQTVLAILTGSPSRRAAADLRRLIQQHAASLPWPGALLVTAQVEPHDLVCDEPLTICTVLAKSSDAVYLRDKEPNLDRITPHLRVVLQIPLNWSPQ